MGAIHIVLFFSYLAWALYGVGLVVACFECGIEYQSGRGSIKDIPCRYPSLLGKSFLRKPGIVSGIIDGLAECVQ